MARKRRANPFTIRLSPELRAQLDAAAIAADISLGGLFISAVQNTPPPRRSRRPHPDRDLLLKLLGLLGNIGGNLNQLAKAAKVHERYLRAPFAHAYSRILQETPCD